MSTVVSVAVAAGPLAAGWSVHGVWFWRRMSAARHDPLTGLLRRDAFEARAARVLRGTVPIVVVVDLDGFKALNDTRGHAAGDVALAHVGRRLGVWARVRGGIAARLGGDEFAAAATLDHPDALPGDLRTLHSWLCEPVATDAGPVRLGASLGAIAAPPGAGLPVLLRRADEAMYTAKRGGGGWHIAHGLTPHRPTANGRRAGRRGTAGGAP
ncbi:GGDEF domain-containing protein [Streptomyces huiliensis]|uniref:GGDEF domain-containing protein n=1 Tax=Streptomyces huiliensis TaxID=2876027 RepID=UPI001CBDCDD3|nr:GGDEF domain-containing protein [Streptomyces huiliensis]MBZ4322479.1 GGDEF domain-containing protein [Streptomyces huiliensis]